MQRPRQSSSPAARTKVSYTQRAVELTRHKPELRLTGGELRKLQERAKASAGQKVREDP